MQEQRIYYTRSELRKMRHNIIRDDVRLLRDVRTKARKEPKAIKAVESILKIRFRRRHHDIIAGTTQLRGQDKYYYHWETQ